MDSENMFIIMMAVVMINHQCDGHEKFVDQRPDIGDGIDNEEARALMQSPFQLATSHGLSITGTVEATEGDNIFYAFRGIKYAKSPINELRFKKPEVLLQDWSQLSSASDGPACPQSKTDKLEISEDCLWLNVFTPELSHLENPSLEAKYDVANGYLHEHKFSKHAVLVFLHPAGPNWDQGWAGDDDYGPTHLLDYEVLLVTVNYRLGSLGFGADGQNLGLRDQLAALEWIQSNIDTFGGDKDRVTIVGHGSGGASAHYHLLSPLSSGKFKSAISMSGSATNWWALTNDESISKLKSNLKSSVGCDITTGCQNIDYKKIVSSAVGYRLGPVVDGEFIPQSPEAIMASGKFNHAQWLVGLTRDEGYALANTKSLSDSPESLLGTHSKYWPQIKSFYAKNNYELKDIISDSWFNAGVDKSVRLMGEYSKGAVYYYRLNQPNVTLDKTDTPLSHGEELPYLFPMILKQPQEDEENQLFRKIFLRMLSDFVRYGHPTTNAWNRQHLHHTYWRHYKSEKREFIEMAHSQIKMKKDMNKERFEFWNSLGQKTEL